jgi:hypothetical protein
VTPPTTAPKTVFPDNMDLRLLVVPFRGEGVRDTHPEELLEFVQDGITTPVGWFHVVAYTHKGLSLLIPRSQCDTHPERPEEYVKTPFLRAAFWHVDRFYAGEVARQLAEHERTAFAWHQGYSRWKPYPVDHVVVYECTGPGDGLVGDWVEVDRKIHDPTIARAPREVEADD